MTRHAAIWIDQQEARIFHVEAESVDESMIEAPRRHIQRHPKGPTEEHHHPDDLHRFLRDVAVGLRDADQILVTGPSTAKLQLLRYLHQNEREIEQRIVGIETVDHPTDRQLVAYVRRYYRLGEERAR
jgi:stalled ribosome rescue protein Dom34